MTAEYRVDPETGDWHLVAPERAQRPTDQSSPKDGSCPFCPGNEASTRSEVLRVPADHDRPWRVRVVPNRYPVVSPARPSPNDDGPAAGRHEPSPNGGGPAAGRHEPSPNGGGPAHPATGRHEVVIETPDHAADLRAARPEQVREVLGAIRERCRAMAGTGTAAIVVFRNHGAAAGTSLRHPHSQIVCLDQAPPRLAARWDRTRLFFERTGRCLHDDVAAAERAEAARVVRDDEDLLIYQPRAASVTHETVLMPTDTSADLAGASDEALDAVARALPAVTAALAAVRDDPAYNLVIHAGPAGDENARAWYRWHIGLYPRVSRHAGLEIATGLAVSPSVPEQTAPVLRQALAELWQPASP